MIALLTRAMRRYVAARARCGAMFEARADYRHIYAQRCEERVKIYVYAMRNDMLR